MPLPTAPPSFLRLVLALMAFLSACSSLAIFPSHEMAFMGDGELDDNGWTATLNRNARSFAQSFPYSTLAYYRSLKPLMLKQFRTAQQKYDEQQQLERKLEEGRELANMLRTLNGPTTAAAADGNRKRRSDGGVVLKTDGTSGYACRFKFCRIFSPNER